MWPGIIRGDSINVDGTPEAWSRSQDQRPAGQSIWVQDSNLQSAHCPEGGPKTPENSLEALASCWTLIWRGASEDSVFV